MRRLVLGDVHGKLDYLLEVFEKSSFDYENDLLIQIGDLVDRGPEPFLCIDEMLKIKNRIFIKGNHDTAFISVLSTGESFLGDHAENGQRITMQSWNQLDIEGRKRALSFFSEQVDYHVTSDNIMFVHGGFPRDEKLEEILSQEFHWDREMWNQAMSCKGDQKLKTLYDFKDIYIGHTPTIYWDETKPMIKGGITNIDTGCGKSGPLTIYDIDSKEYWQSNNNFLKTN